MVHLAVYRLLTKVFSVHYLLAAFLGYMLGFLWNYITSLLWVFTSRHSRRKEVAMVALITIGGLLWTEFIMYLFVEFAGLHDFLAMIITLWIVLIWNFAMRKRYVFH